LVRAACNAQASIFYRNRPRKWILSAQTDKTKKSPQAVKTNQATSAALFIA